MIVWFLDKVQPLHKLTLNFPAPSTHTGSCDSVLSQFLPVGVKVATCSQLNTTKHGRFGPTFGFWFLHSNPSGIHSLHHLCHLSFFFSNSPPLRGSQEFSYQLDDCTYHRHISSLALWVTQCLGPHEVWWLSHSYLITLC
jgi:hypothetical protein